MVKFQNLKAYDVAPRTKLDCVEAMKVVNEGPQAYARAVAEVEKSLMLMKEVLMEFERAQESKKVV